MAPDMKEISRMVIETVREGRNGQMETTMKAPLSKTSAADLETITGLMEDNTLATGVRTRRTDRVSSNGKMEGCTPVSLSMIFVKEMAHRYGLMDANTSANGRLERSTVSVPTLMKTE